jgi:hypothetical protein
LLEGQRKREKLKKICGEFLLKKKYQIEINKKIKEGLGRD